MNGSAPNTSLTGSQSLLIRKRQPNFCSASCEPCVSSRTMSAMRAKMTNAMTSVSHLKARSPKRELPRFVFIASCIVIFCRSRGNEALFSPEIIQSLLASAPTFSTKSKRRRAGGTALFVRLTLIKLPGSGAKSSSNCANQVQYPVLNVVRQGRVVERGRNFLAIRDRPLQKGDEFPAMFGAFLLLINQNPARAGDGICLVARRIDHGEPEIIGDFRGGQRGV